MSPRKAYLRVALVAALVRLVYFTQHLASPLVDHPVLDGEYFDLAARTLAAGELSPGLASGFRSLLYPRLLALVYSLAGDWDIYAALALQHLLGVVTAVLVAALAWRLWARPGAALAAGVVYALGAPPLFFEGELLVESLFCAVVAAQLLAFAAADELSIDRRSDEDDQASSARSRRVLALALVAGALAATGVRLRPNHLLFVAALPLLLLPEATRAARRKVVAAALVGAAATLLLLAAWERPLLGRLQLVPGAGGVNLYLGNKRSADGMIPRQDWSVTYADPYRDSVEVFAEEAYRRAHELPRLAHVEPRALSRYWLGRTAAEIAADPWGRLALAGRKVLLFFWNAEIQNNRSLDFAAREEVRLLAFLPVRFGLLLALAAAGVAAALAPRRALRRTPALDTVLLFVVSHAFGVVLFFVNDRYRLPVWPALAALAGGGVVALADPLRQRRWRELARPLGVAAAAALLSFPNWTGVTLPGAGRDLLFRSTALLDHGLLAEARADAERAAALEPLEDSSWLQLGNVCRAQDDLACAESAYRRALDRHPGHTAALHYLGELRERAGDVGAAHRLYCAAIEAEPGFPLPLLAAAWLELRAGLETEAERHLAELPKSAHGLLADRLARAELERRRSGTDTPRRVGIVVSEEGAATRLGAILDTPIDAARIEPCRPGSPAATAPP